MQPLAIVGMACRFPGARDLQGFWKLLSHGVDAIRETPPDRWDFRKFPGTSRWGGFLEGVDTFDPSFFGVSPREAAYMDPQQRLLLEVAWEALEDAGLPVERCAGRPTGVFVGISTYDYGSLTMSDPDRILDGYANTGGALSIAANRISYLFDFRGPSMAVDTACSSSLAAAHLACQSLWHGESEVALAGGVNLILSPAITVGFSRLKAMASDGRCKTFDERADGYVRGEGAGFVVLKPLARALEDGDRVYAVVRGSALNQDGRTNGMTAPNGLSQEALIRQALKSAGVEPARVGYVECHGTGTALGDPIELNALGTALAEGRGSGPRCAVGSVKTNIGHLEAAAGIAGLMKLALTLHHREIPPSLHFQKPNPHIPFDTLPLAVQRTFAPWPEPMRPAIGGVSSFGFGGTNVHLVLEEAPAPASGRAAREETAGATADRPCLLPLSARSADALPDLARAWRDLLSPPPGDPADGPAPAAPLADLAFTASRRRSHHEHRLAVAGRTPAEIVDQLDAFLAGEARPGLSTGRAVHGRRRKLAFVFPGQGAQWFGMARGLLRKEPVFRAAFEDCEAAIRAETGWSVRDELHLDAGQNHLDAVDVIQPTLFAIQVALAALWRSWGVQPDAAVGHSMGEVAAAHVAGALSLENAAKVICRRSRVISKLSGKGAMAAVELSIDQARQVLAGYESLVSIGVSNSPSSTVLSGDPAALDEIIKKLEDKGVFCRRVNTSAVAGHSPQMDAVRDELLEVLREVDSRPAQVPLYSTVTGEIARDVHLDAAYWMRNLREPVLFALAVGRLLEAGHTIFLELSPHPILLQAIHQTLRHLGKEGATLPSLRRDDDEQAVMIGSLGGLFTLGRTVRWEAVGPTGRCVPLPAYPWQRERFWLEEAKKKKPRSGSSHPILGTHVESAATGAHFWDVELSVDALPWLADHRVQGSVVLPAAAYLEIALSAAREAFGPHPHAIADVDFKRALLVPDQGEQRMQLVVTPGHPGAATFQFFGLTAEADVKTTSAIPYATGTLRLAPAGSTPAPPDRVPPAEVQARCGEKHDGRSHYEDAHTRGVDYGPAFQAVQEVWRRDGEAIARLRTSPETPEGSPSYLIHPALLDGCFQVLAAAVPSPSAGNDIYLPVGLRSLRLAADRGAAGALWGYARLGEGSVTGGPELQGDVSLLDEAGQVVLTAAGLRLKRLEADRSTVRENPDDWLYGLRWQPATVPPPAAARPGRKVGRWILFADERGVGQALRILLEARGEGCVVVSRGEQYEATSPGHYRLDPGQPEHFRQLLRDAFGNGGPACRGVVHLWSLDDDALGQEETTLAALERAREWGCLSVLHAVQALVLTGRREQPRMWLVTARAQAVEPGAAPVAVGQSLLWGLARTITHEHPELGCTSVDLGSPRAEEAAALFAEICADDREDQVALRGQARYVARLARFSPEAAPRRPATGARDENAAGAEPFRLETSGARVLESLSLHAAPRRQPGAGEVEIQVVAAGLNFKDVLLALGLLPALPDGSVPLGFECAGTITAVGDGVERFRPGEAVIAISAHALSSHVVADAAFVAPKPAPLGFEEAATLPVAFLTAYYALHHLGRLAPGERVLIHSASGGVGLAAVQIARQTGAEIFATAGTPEKRSFLRSLGIERVSDSRSMAFADDVMEWTSRQGVDVVLNSLAGEAIPRGMALLKPGGRFLELGKRDILENNPLGLQLLENNRSFFAVDLHLLSRDRPTLVASMLAETMRFFDDHALQPLPLRVFPASQAESAFRYMAQGKHVGKVVLSMQDPAVSVAAAPATAEFAASATYLVTGGLSGLGLVVARWMVERGARNVVLLGRRGPSPETKAAVDVMERAGARVVIASADVSDARQMAAVLADLDARLPPLRGVVHAAGVLDDGILLQMDAPRLRSVMAPKVDGAWNLHLLTAGRPLDFFVLFASAAGVLGSPGQGNYAAANAFLDALAHHRRARGLPALSIDWGPWSEVGLAARPDRAGRLAAQGMKSVDPARGVACMARLWTTAAPQVSVMPVDWPEWRQVHRAAAGTPLLADFQDDGSAGLEAPVSGLAAALAQADGPAERQKKVETYLQKEVARVLGLAVSRLDVTQPLSTLGIDSLMAVELKNRIESELQVSVPLIRVIQGPSVAELSALLLNLLAGVDPAFDAPPKPPAEGTGKDSLLLSILSLREGERE